MAFWEQVWYVLNPRTNRKEYKGFGQTGLSLLYRDIASREETVKAMKSWRYDTAMYEAHKKGESDRKEYWPDRVKAWKKEHEKKHSTESSGTEENSLRHHAPSQRRRMAA